RAAHRAAGQRRSGAEARSPDSRRRLHRCRAREVRTRRAPARRHVVCHRAVQGAPSRHQCLGPLPAVGAIGHLTSVAGDLPPIAGLADEYYTSAVAYLPAAARVEPWEPNATALVDPAALKWKDLVAPGTPVPTPWPKEEFERYTKEIQARRRAIRAANRPEAEMDALFRDEQARDTALLG